MSRQQPGASHPHRARLTMPPRELRGGIVASERRTAPGHAIRRPLLPLCEAESPVGGRGIPLIVHVPRTARTKPIPAIDGGRTVHASDPAPEMLSPRGGVAFRRRLPLGANVGPLASDHAGHNRHRRNAAWAKTRATGCARDTCRGLKPRNTIEAESQDGGRSAPKRETLAEDRDPLAT